MTDPSPPVERGIGRLEAFSDGVFAIAVTLLVLDVRVPRGVPDLAAALLAQWPSYVGFVGSFVIIGIWWAGQHALLDNVARSDQALRVANLLHLLPIAFLPFATALLTEYLDAGGRQLTTASVVYVGTLLLAALTYDLIWRCAVAGDLLQPTVGPAAVARLNRLYMLSTASYVVAFALAFVLPLAALAICIAIALYYGLPRRGSAH